VPVIATDTDAAGMGQFVGENLARFRKAHDLSQEHLAEKAGVGVDTIARLEQGKRSTTRPSTLSKLACALDVTVDQLLGRLLQQASPHNEITSPHNEITALRRAITSDGDLFDFGDFAEPAETVGLVELTQEVHNAWNAYVAGRHADLLGTLPALLVDGRRLVHSATDDDRAKANRVLSTAYRLGAGISSRLGFTDLAWSSADRALDAARSSDSPDLQVAISLRYLVWTLVRQSRVEEAEHLATTAAERIQPVLLDRDPQRAGVFGNLLFNAASAALLAQRPAGANDFLAEAQAAALRANADFANEAAIFGPRVAAFQRVDLTVRAGDPELALHLADTVPTTDRCVPAFWEAGYNVSLAAASADIRDDRRALDHLARAYHLAPGWSPHQPLGRLVMRRLVDRAARRRGDEFSRLARLYGVVQ
jgi:transcriptional regulator with XRE-family HTH domain